jgi:hypothetical protein
VINLDVSSAPKKSVLSGLPGHAFEAVMDRLEAI